MCVSQGCKRFGTLRTVGVIRGVTFQNDLVHLCLFKCGLLAWGGDGSSVTPQKIDHNNTFPCTFLCHAQHGLIIAFEDWLNFSFKISWAKKNPKFLSFAIDLYTVQCTEGAKVVWWPKGFEGIEAVAASYLRLHPEVCVCVCVCVSVAVCLCVSVSMALCMCVCVFVCVCVLSGHRTIIRPIWWCGQRPSTPTTSHLKISALVHPQPTSSVRPPFFGVWSLHWKPATKTGKRGSYLQFEDISSRFAC